MVLHPLLPSMTSLTTLALESSAYFSPDTLVAQIRSMAQPQTLSFSFLSTAPRPGFRNDRFLPLGPLSRFELPWLMQLIY
jgi:hypothetical protein